MSIQPVDLPDLEEQRVVFAAAGLDVDDDGVLGPLPHLHLVPEIPRQPGRIRIKERDNPKDWTPAARCRREEIDVNVFFPTRHSTLQDVEDAKTICRDCPVRWACLAYSVLNWEKLGIWGGYTEIERREVRRYLKRQIDAGHVDQDDPVSVQVALEERWGESRRPIRRGEGHGEDLAATGS